MASCLGLHKPPILSFLRLPGCQRLVRRVCLGSRSNRRASFALAIAGVSDSEFSGLNTPLEPKSPTGRFLSGVLQNELGDFRVAAGEQLQKLAADRDEAAARSSLSFGSDEPILHRRIAELRKQECKIAVEEIMYMLVLYKFNEIRVQLIPRLSRCIYNGRLEIGPSKDCELESVHNFEVLEMVREHLTAVIGWRPDSNVTDNWALAQIPRLQLCQVYTASILYGYFLKSAFLRHHLELSLDEANYDLGMTRHNALPLSESWPFGLTNIALGCSTRSTSVGQESRSLGKKHGKLRCYVMGFDPETLQMCAKPRTNEAMNLVENHSCALFGDEKTGLIETNEVILTSLLSLKRMVLEAVAFGSFLWDSEEYVDSVYKFKEN